MTLHWVEAEPVIGVSPAAEFRLRALDRHRAAAAKDPWRFAALSVSEATGSLSDLLTAVARDDALSQVLRLPRHQAPLGLVPEAPWALAGFARQGLGPLLHRRKGCIEGFRLQVERVGAAMPAEAVGAPEAEPRPAEDIVVDDGAVIMGVIDNGLAFGGSPFRRSATETRVEWAWVMDAPATDVGVPSGRALLRGEIDELLLRRTRSGLLDDAGFNRDAGLTAPSRAFNPAARRLSHGTHVMSLAAGTAEPGRPRPILCVSLPTPLVGDPGGAGLSEAIAVALGRLLSMAAQVRTESGDRPPVVVTLSYGDFAGPHDGTGWTEAALAQAMADAAAAGLTARLVLPAGNGNLARCHAALTFPAGVEARRLNWRLPPDDRTASEVELWTPALPVGAQEGAVEVRATPPFGPESPPVGGTFGEAWTLVNGDGCELARLSFERARSDERGVARLVTAPTESFEAPRAAAPAGRWGLRVRRCGLADGAVVHAWVERDETLPGFRSAGRQARFDDPLHERFDTVAGDVLDADPQGAAAAVRRAFTLSGYVTGGRADMIVAGGYAIGRRGRPSLYSATGPGLPRLGTAVPARTGPDALAPADESRVAPGVMGAGSAEGSAVAMGGTSVAAPQVARMVATALQDGLAGDRAWVRHRAVLDELGPDAPAGPAPTAPRGAARLTRRFSHSRVERRDVE